MGYSSDDSNVRVDFFKASGKWYATEAVPMGEWYHDPLDDALKSALNEALYMPKGDRLRYSGMTAVCLEPYHKTAHPIMLQLPERGKFQTRIPAKTWTRKYEIEDVVEIQVCVSPNEWERAEVSATHEDRVEVWMLSGAAASVDDATAIRHPR